jgi:hypothetical protein
MLPSCKLNLSNINYKKYNYHLFNVFSNSLISFKWNRENMLENIVYGGIGFAAVFFALESAWHFIACKIHDKSIKPCFYKQVGLLK